MNRTTGILALILAASLAWAYSITHTKGGASSGLLGSVPVWRIAPEAVERLTYHSGSLSVVLEPDWSTGTAAPYIKVKTTSTASSKPGMKADPERVFNGNARAASLVKGYAELVGKRRIGVLSELISEEFGFPAPTEFIEIEGKWEGSPWRLNLGAENYGNTLRYGLSSRDNEVFLFSRSLIRPLARARAELFETALFPLGLDDARRIRLLGKGTERSLWRLPLPPSEPNRWAGNPEDPRGMQHFQKFVLSLQQLRAMDFVAEGEGIAAVAPLVEIQVFPKEKSAAPHWVKLFPGAGPGRNVSSSFARGTVQVNGLLADRVVESAVEILSNP